MHGLGPTRTRVLSLLQSTSGPLTVGEVADQLDLHKNSARFHLDALVSAGFAERQTRPSGRTGRPPLLYAATDESPTIGNAHLLELTNVLLSEFVAPSDDASNRAQAAGFNWGQGIREGANFDMAELKDHLAQRGFGVMEADGGLAFTRCPFRDVISPEQLPLVCALHQGMLEAFVADDDVEFGPIDVGPRVCHAKLLPAAG